MISPDNSPLGRILPRYALGGINAALSDTRVVVVNGARQCGKSTIAAQIAGERNGKLLSLDQTAVRQAAYSDPSGFVRGDGLLVIDEVQRIPDLLLEIKNRVDGQWRPGSFLLTGSARVFGLRSVVDALPGRSETIELWPLAQGEIDQTPQRFVDAIFEAGPELRHFSSEDRAGYVERVVRGGFPEAVAREGQRRQRFLDSYLADLVNRDVMQVSQIHRASEMRALIRLVAARSSQLLVAGALANELNVSQPTAKSYLGLLEEVFLIKQIPAWSRNLSTRAVGTPKVAMVDSAIAANLLNLDKGALRPIGSPLGSILEGFVAMEIARQLTWSNERVEMFHYRTKDKAEVGIVLENRRGQVVGIEVKASSTVRGEDFRGLRHLAQRTGEDFVAGVVLYIGEQTLTFGPKLRAMPISAVWEVGVD